MINWLRLKVKRRIIICLALFSLVVLSNLVGCSKTINSQTDKKNVDKTEVQNQLDKDKNNEKDKEIQDNEISMEQAIEIASKEASKYYDNLKVTEAHSYDNDSVRRIDAGSDGKRELWYVDFANEKLNYVSILMQNNEIINVEHYDENGNNGLIKMSDINISAKNAVEKAKSLGLRGGDPANEDEWVSGYNFKLENASLVKSPDDIRLFLEVIGISPSGNFAHVDFDAKTGEVLLAEEKLEKSNGEVEWKALEKKKN